MNTLATGTRRGSPAESFSAHLRELVNLKFPTALAFSAAVGMNQGYISKVLNGRQLPSEDAIRQIAPVLDADVDDLIWRSGIMPDEVAEALFGKPYAEVLAFVGIDRP